MIRSPERKRQEELDRKEALAELRRRAAFCRRFVGDKRHAEYREFWQAIIAERRSMRENLPSSAQSNDEYLRMGLILDTQINTIRWMLETPEAFIEAEKKQEEDAREKHGNEAKEPGSRRYR